MRFQIDPTLREPVYRQLERQIKEWIAKGEVPPHTQLPVVREMAMRLLLNPNTVQRVYNDLTREGVLYSRRGAGVFVAEIVPKLSLVETKRRAVAAIDGVITECVHLDMPLDDIRNVFEDSLKQFARGADEDE